FPKLSPVPAYMTRGSAGLMTIDETDRTAMKSSTGAHDAPALVVRQMPPLTLPAKISFGFAGLIASARMRPPTFPGPSQRHWRGETLTADAGVGAEGSNSCGPIGAASPDSTRRTAPRVFSTSTCAFARPYGFGRMRPFAS